MFLRRYAKRLRVIAILFATQLALWSVLRIILLVTFADDVTRPWQLATIIASGLAFDVLAALTTLLPVIFLLSAFRIALLSRPWLRHSVLAFVYFVFSFNVVVEFFFFEEYSARFNHLALDYLMYPDEVFGNIFASYNVPLFVALAMMLAALLTWMTGRLIPAAATEWHWRDRLSGGAATLVVGAALWLAWSAAPDAIGQTRISGEVALNGWAQLIRAYLTSHLDYEAYYSLVSPAEADVRVARLVNQAVPGNGLLRHFAPRGRTTGEPLDIVIIMEESLGSNFSARFSGTTDDPVTPELDKWSHEGLTLTNLIANGNRTVRGMEGILCSFLPLPGDAVVKRDRSENVASIARVLAAQGYQTTFFTGGYGLFDNVKPFMTANGFNAFVEQPDYPSDAFRTVWGVADEHVFDHMIARQKQARVEGKRWFSATITGSNHKPFDVPPGRVEWPAGQSRRRGAVLYADWAIGHYLALAKRERLLDHTVVLIVGDHGARVYGAEEIPVTSYRIPAVFFTPDARYRGAVIDRLTSQIDLAPTLLSLAGVTYDAPFFGQDLLGLTSDGGRAFVNHNRSIGMLTDRLLVVLGLHQTKAFYTRSGKDSDTFVRIDAETSELKELAADASAAFQTAYQVYRERRYVLP
jgi:phosphoglycerol transferase MdoB-like AlkP superfamily enzyme